MDELELTRRKLEREKTARQEAERLLETKSGQLYSANQQLQQQYEALVKRNAKIELLDSIVKFAQQSPPFREMIQRFVDVVCSASGWPVGHAYVPADDRPDMLVPLKTWHIDDAQKYASFRSITEETEFQVGVGLPGRVLASGEPAWIGDVHDDPNFPRARACRDIEVCAAFGVPIKVYDRIVAIAEFYAGQACQKDPWLLDVVHTTAQQLGSLLERRQAEDRFRLVVESAPNGIVMIDRTGRIVLVNSETERLFGYQRGELRGQSIEVLVPQRFQAAHPAHRAGFFTNPLPRAMGAGRDLFGLRKDGSEVPVEIGLSPLKTEQGTFVLASIVDITARKRAEDELRRTGERLRLATQIGKIGIWEWDIVGNHVTWTDSIYAIHGVTREQFVPTVEGFTQLVHPEDRQIVSRSIERSVQEGAPYEPTFRAIRPDGREIWLFTTGNVLRDASGNPLRMLGVVMDITERKKAELELAAAVQELTIRNQEMQQFVHTVSHDLKAPLITMLGFVTLLKQELRDGRTDALSDAARRIEASARKMERLIADLLQLSRIGRVKDEPSEVDVVALLGEVQELLSIQIRHSGAQIHIERDMPKLFIDRTRLMQVFENLLSNAVKYGCEGSDRRIEVGAQLSDDEVRFYIRDYGPGIPAEQREAIFGLFQRLHTDDRGTGVGLAIVAKVMQVYAGRCWVESDPGHGATFWLAFPHTLLSRPVRRASLPAHSSAGAAAAGSPPAA